jgi:hypothetical protein
VSGQAIPLAETGLLERSRRRTTVLRLGLAAVVLAAAVFAVVAAGRIDGAGPTVLGKGRSGVVVLDLSSSTESAPPRDIPGVLRQLANAGGRSGLVLFSDIAYEALPLAASSEQLRPFLRFFRRPPQVSTTAPIRRPPTPWTRSFRSGTRISAGLAEARRMVLEESPSRAQVLLVSDLNDSLFDVAALEQELRRYRRLNLGLRIVALNATPESRSFFASRLGEGAFVTRPAYAEGLAGKPVPPLQGTWSWLLVGLALAAAGLLAVNELACGRMEWGGS